MIKFEHKISVVETQVNIAVSKRFDLSNLDKAVCWLLKEVGYISIESAGVLLGLGTTEYRFANSQKKIHKDLTEIELLRNLLSQVESFHLISIDDKEGLNLTDQGESGLETNNKYHYLNAQYSHYNLLDISLKVDNTPFPYYKLGLQPKIQEGKPEKSLPNYLSESLGNTPDIEQIKSTLGQNYPDIKLIKLLDANLGKIERKINVQVEVELELSLVSFSYDGNSTFQELNTALLDSSNESIKKYLIQKALYLDNLNSKKIFSLSLINNFSNYDFFSLNHLIENELITWNEDLIEFTVNWEATNSITWELISKLCPTELLLNKLELVNDFLDWSLLTSKCIQEPSLILSSCELNWDPEVILSEFDQINLEKFVKRLRQKLGEEVESRFLPEQWILLTSLITDSFLEKNIYTLPFDFRYVTREKEKLTKTLLTESVQWKDDPWGRKLDWSFISENYDLDFLAKNFRELQDYVDPETLILKLGQFPDRLSKFLESEQTAQLRERLSQLQFKIGIDSSISINAELLTTLDSLGYLQWGNQLFKGVEHNLNLTWSASLVSQYKEKLLALADQPLSIKLDSLEVVELNHSLNWDKIALLSKCEQSEFDLFFLKWCEEEMLEDWKILLQNRIDLELSSLIQITTSVPWLSLEFDWLSVLDRIKEIESIHLNKLFSVMGEEKRDVTSYLSRRINLDEVLQKSNLNWDWTIVTTRIIKERDDFNLYERFKHNIDWELVFRKKYSTEEIIKTSFFDGVKKILEVASYPMRQKAYRYITQVYLDHAIIEEHFENNQEYFDWDLISENQAFVMRLMRKAISGDYSVFSSLSQFISKSLFTCNKAFIGSLKKLEVESVDGWEKRVEGLLVKLESLIDWVELSTQKDFSSYEFLIKRFDHQIDWKGVSYSSNLIVGNDQKPNDDFLKKYNDKIDFFALSSRLDLLFDNDFIKTYSNKQLNFSHLSVADNSRLTEEIFNHKEKSSGKLQSEYGKKLIDYPWDFGKLSVKNGFWKTGDVIAKYPDKPWNWRSILASSGVKIGEDIIRYLQVNKIDKELNWFEVTSRKNFKASFKTLKSFNSEILPLLNWDYLSTQTGRWKYTEISKFKQYWRWESLAWLQNGTKRIKEIEDLINAIDIKTLSAVIDVQDLFNEDHDYLWAFVDWSVICQRTDCQEHLYQIENLEKYRNYIDWTYLSSITTFPFTIELLETFTDHWNWRVLGRNPVIKESFQSVLENKMGSSNKLVFFDRLSHSHSPWAGKIYHFTHVENALNIIEKECVYSRNAVVDFNDSAGSVVGRRETAHDYARFYFRPLTLTQFYNEQLGKDRFDNYYEKAFRLELPKCPVPVFFQFDLAEILQNKDFDCYVSNGNMQTNNARVIKIDNSLQLFDFENVYAQKTWEHRSATQQEFLVKGKFKFSSLINFRILVPDNFTKNYLETFISSEKIRKRIQVASSSDQVFHFNNCSIRFDTFNKKEAKISTDYGNKHHFEIVFNEAPDFGVLEGEGLVTSHKRVRFSKRLHMKLQSSCNYRIDFYNELKKEPWTIVKTKL